MIENEVATLWWRLFFLCEATFLCGRCHDELCFFM